MIIHKYAVVCVFVVSQVFSTFAATARLKLLTQLVHDVVVNEEVPSVLGAVTCWSKKDDFYFANELPIPIQIMKNAAQIQQPQSEVMNKYWFFIDMKCTNFKTLLNELNPTYFAHPFRWIIVDVNFGTIASLPIRPDSNVIVANSHGTRNEYAISQSKEIFLIEATM